jgi:hypothetical protein
MKAIIICERDGWTWRVEGQEDCHSGVDIVYQEEDRLDSRKRTCLGDLEDAKALGKAILAYVEFMEKNNTNAI